MKSSGPSSKRFFFGLLLIAFVCLFFWWLFYIPYDADALHRSVPGGAVFVSEHHDLAERWPDLIGNPIAEGAARLSGVSPAGIISADTASHVQRLMRLLASRNTLIAFSPAAAPENDGTWTISTWIGGRALLLRTGIISRFVPGMKVVRLRDGSRIWVIEPSDNRKPGPKLSFAVMDGVLSGCLSEDPRAAQWILFKMQGRLKPTVHSVFACLDSGRYSVGKGADWGWLGMRESDVNRALFYHLRELNRDCVEAAASFGRGERERADHSPAGKDLSAAHAKVRQLFRSTPVLFAVTRFEKVSAILGASKDNRVIRHIETLVPGVRPGSEVFAGIYGGEESGRILGLRVPTLIVGIRLDDAAGVIDEIDRALDTINAGSGWGLIPKRIEIDEKPVVVIDTTRGGIYSGVNPDERMALTARDEWLIVASNVRALRELVSDSGARAVSTVSRGIEPDALWVPEEGKTPTDVYIQADLPQAGQAIKDALAVISLGFLVGDAPGRARHLENLARARNFVDAFAPMGVFAGRFDLRDEEVEMAFRLERTDSDKKP